MCWVMPPASVLTTDDSRMASSSVVLPWSTWPMIVTTGGRSTRVVGSSSKTTSSSSSSSVCVSVISRLSSVPISSTASSVSETVSVTISPRPIISVMILAGEIPSASARSLTVMPDGTLTGPVGASGSRLGSDRGAPRSRRWAGLRPAWASMTTRRLPLGEAPRCGRGARPGCAGLSSEGAVAFAPNSRRISLSSAGSSAIYLSILPRGIPPPGIDTPRAREDACLPRRRGRPPRPPSAPAHAAAGAGRSRRTGASGCSPRRRAPLLGRGQRHVRGDAAVAAPVERLVGATLAGRRDRDAAARELVLLALGAGVGLVGVVGVVLGLADDVDPPPGQAMGEAGVLPLLADRERELAVGHDHGRLAVVVVDVHLAHLGGRERLGDEPGRLVVPRDDVDLL